MKLVVALLSCLLALTFTGCLGGDDDDGGDSNRATAYDPDFKFQVKEGIVPKAESTGADAGLQDYVPEGEIVADSGFRPEIDGFAFENYGNDVGPENMDASNMEALFGEAACLEGSGDDCVLTPAAQAWMDNQNEGMAGGHCQGFSVAALRMYGDQIDQEDFGGELTAELEIVGNTELQSSIAEHFTYQFLPPVVNERVKGTPSEVLEVLIDALESGDELYTLGIYKSDFTGGHAITPFAVEDKGDGQFAILVYDNNFPGQVRAVEVDTNAEEWRYIGGPNPQDANSLYEGNAESQTLELDPTNPGTEVQPCVFCADDALAEGESKGSTLLPESEQYSEITLSGDPRNHPHLVFSDDEGRRTGIVNGKFLQEIPDVEVVKTYAIENWKGAPEPRYRLPQGKNYTITVDGSDLTKPTETSIDLIGNGLVIEIDEIKMEPGQQDNMALPGGYGITYQTNAKDEIAPNMFAGLVEGDVYYNFAISAVGVKPGSTLSLLVEQKDKVMILDSTGAESSDQLGGEKAFYIAQLTRGTADGEIAIWQNNQVRLDGTQEEKAGFEYAKDYKPGKAIPLVLLDKNAEPTDVIKLKPQDVPE